MRRGDVLGGRFHVEERVSSGGMGEVFRGRDASTGAPVAVKVLLGGVGTHEARFGREAQALSELSHPGIVRYVGHGAAASGEPYLAMEWLEGEDLSRRLRRGALTIAESVAVALRVAEALGAAHGHGIVHRDLKPGNIFLVNGHIEQIKLLDFGIVQWGSGARITDPGCVVGTPGYLAPEQAQSNRRVDSRADIFSLGCVLFECLTGAAAFEAAHPLALLAKVMHADPPRLRNLRTDAPEALESLLSRFLAKDPDARPSNGVAAAEALAALDLPITTPTAGVPPMALTRGERRTISVVLVGGDDERGIADARRRDEAATETLDPGDADSGDALRRGAEVWGGRLSRLLDGSVAVSIRGAGLATDQAAQAARCALWLRGHVESRTFALATGREDTTGRGAAGDAIDRAAKMILSRATAAARAEGSAEHAPAPIAIDEMTARLLDGRFDVREGDEGLALHGEREMAEGARLLLRKPTACVGRDRELATLAQMLEECVEEPLAQAVLVTGAAGMGKSRVAQEFLARLRLGGERVAVWIGRGDSLRAGSPLGMLSQALRSACGIRGDEPLPERREKLRSRVAQRIAGPEQQRVAEILGELVGAPFPDEASVLLRTARRNPQIMTDELRRAWLDFLRAECAAQPVLLILEDLHWGDGATARFIDTALRDLWDCPWMVLALARPEAHDLFPKLWADRRTQEIALKPLGRKAGERLVRQVLGAEIGAETAERIITQADGNAFYLEELIRAAAERREGGLPETVIAMVQSRLAALDEEDRRVLRGAAVFGEVFWPGGVGALLGDAERSARVLTRLHSLVEREVLIKRPESRFAGEMELAFRHVLLREGAYAMLTGDDCRMGHRLAGEWLERAGEKAPKLLAEHFDRGACGPRAAAYYLSAAKRALDGGDCDAAIKLCERGVALGQEADMLAELRAIEADARCRGGDLEGACRAAREALGMARPGSRSEGRALHAWIFAAIFLRSNDMLREPVERLLQLDPEPDGITLFAAACFSVIISLIFMAQGGASELYLRRLEQVAGDVMDRDPMTMFWIELARSIFACHVQRDFWGFREHARGAVSQYQRSGVGGIIPYAGIFVAAASWQLGFFDAAEQEWERTLASAPANGLDGRSVKQHRFLMRIDQRRLDEALSLGESIIQEAEALGEALVCTSTRLFLAEVYLYKGAIETAESQALALREVAAEPLLGAWYLAVLARIRLAQGRPEEAVELVERGYSQFLACDTSFSTRHMMLLLVRAEAFFAAGDREAARRAIREAKEDLLRSAAKIPDPDVRRRFFESSPDRRRTLELADQWL